MATRSRRLDDPNPLRDLIARNQENIAGAAIISLMWSICYAFFKKLPLRDTVLASATAALFSATLWLFLAQYISAPLFVLFPVAVGCGVFSFSVMRAWTKRDGEFADAAVGGSVNLMARFLRRFGGKSDGT